MQMKIGALDPRIRVAGSKSEVKKATHILRLLHTDDLSEGEARILIQQKIDERRLKARILFSGNGVWSLKKIERNLRKIINHGTLYNRKKPRSIPIGSMLRMPTGGDPLLTKYFYSFLNLCCGSIAHYDIHGWILQYPTVEDLRQFFIKNEFGKRVLDSIPGWKTDVKRIVALIEFMLGIENIATPPNFNVFHEEDGVLTITRPDGRVVTLG